MLDLLLRSCLKNRLAPFVLAAVLACGGWYAFTQLTVEAFPDPTDTQVQIITLFSGQPTEEVERRVSIPLERVLNGIPGLFRQRSVSLFGLSFVTLTFNDGVDPRLARQQVLERIAQADLPEGVQPGLGPMATPIGEVYRYTIDGGGADPMTLRTLQDWQVRPQILQVQGVADVVSYGGLLKEFHVEPDPTRMASLNVGLEDVFDALKKASDNASGGYLERGAEMFVIRSLGIFRDLGDIEQVRVAWHRGVPVTVKDVATVRVGFAPRQGVVSRDADEDAVEGIVLMRRGENPSVVLAGLRDKIADINGRILPKGIAVRPFYDRTELVDTTLHTVFHNLVEGALLVVLVLFLFMLSVRASLMTADALMRSLGRPNREQVVTTRPDQLTTLQAIDLANGKALADLLTRGAAALRKAHPKATAAELTEIVYVRALCRKPTAGEVKVAGEILGEKLTDEGVADLLWAVFMLPEFQLIR